MYGVAIHLKTAVAATRTQRADFHGSRCVNIHAKHEFTDLGKKKKKKLDRSPLRGFFLVSV